MSIGSVGGFGTGHGDEPTALLFHIAPVARWLDVEGTRYTDPSLDAEGFLHCSTAAQVLIPANERFGGRTDLVLLAIDPRAVAAEIVFEDCYDSGMAFPHIYGALNVDAVVAVVPFPPNPDGSFSLPEGLELT